MVRSHYVKDLRNCKVGAQPRLLLAHWCLCVGGPHSGDPISSPVSAGHLPGGTRSVASGSAEGSSERILCHAGLKIPPALCWGRMSSVNIESLGKLDSPFGDKPVPHSYKPTRSWGSFPQGHGLLPAALLRLDKTLFHRLKKSIWWHSSEYRTWCGEKLDFYILLSHSSLFFFFSLIWCVKTALDNLAWSPDLTSCISRGGNYILCNVVWNSWKLECVRL